MKRLIVVLVVLLSACGGGGTDSTEQAAEQLQSAVEQIDPTSTLPRLQIIDNETAIDNSTGLHWDRYPSTSMTLDNANTYCANTGQGWRLPTEDELTGLHYSDELGSESDWLSAIDAGIFDFAAIDDADIDFPLSPSTVLWTADANPTYQYNSITGIRSSVQAILGYYNHLSHRLWRVDRRTGNLPFMVNAVCVRD